MCTPQCDSRQIELNRNRRLKNINFKKIPKISPADRVGDPDDQGASRFTIAQCVQRIGRLARLTDEKADVVSENGRLAIQKVAGQLDHNRQLGQFFDQLASLKKDGTYKSVITEK
jgi:hypothetical protein